MAFKLAAGKLGFKLGDVLVGLKSGTEDVPEALKMDEGAAHMLPYYWNPDTLAFEVAASVQTVSVVNLGADNALQMADHSTAPGVSFVGTALAGSLPAAAVWRIKRLTVIASTVAVEWAGGEATFDSAWTARETLTYS